MSHSITRIWFREPVPHPGEGVNNELKNHLAVAKAMKSTIAGATVDSIELHGGWVTISVLGPEQEDGTRKVLASRAVPTSNVRAIEPPPPKRGRPPK